MKLYWFFLFLSLGVWYFTAKQDRRYGELRYSNAVRKKHSLAATVMFGILTFFCGLRSGIADTGIYIHLFKNYPIGLDNIVWENVDKDKGFYFLSVLYKTYVSDDYHGWLFIITLVSAIAVATAFKRYASEFGFSCFLFIGTTMFTYLVNGVRQFICVSILFALSYCLMERRFWRYLIWVLLLSTIHNSAIIMIPVYFLVKAKPWNIQTLLIVIGAAVLGTQFDRFFPMLETVLEETSYANYTEVIQEGVGSSIFRLLIAAVPVVLSFLCRWQIRTTGDTLIPIATNMSIINFALYIIATFTSGMTVGRLTTYFDIYNLILLPWLINRVAKGQMRDLIKICAVLCYILFFYYQMVVTWGSLPYESDILNLFIY